MLTHEGYIFVCDSVPYMRSACQNEIYYKTHEGKDYCVLHYPAKGKLREFHTALQRKLASQDFNFRGAWFPYPLAAYETTYSESLNFEGAYFSEPVQFRDVVFDQGTQFSGAVFASSVEFKRVTFKDESRFSQCVFGYTTEFNEVNFKYGQFDKIQFTFEVTFRTCVFEEGANFSSSIFSKKSSFTDANFKALTSFDSTEFVKAIEFHKVTFGGAAFFLSTSFSDYVRFSSDSHSFNFATTFTSFAHAKFDRPERVTFDTLKLSPSWFRNVDARKFEFINILWMDLYDLTGQTRRSIPDEIALINRAQAVTYRQLASNAEENHRYEEASYFRNLAMDARRLELRDHWRPNVFKPSWWSQNVSVLHLLYWAASGYGERIWRATKVLIGIWILFAILYTNSNETWWRVNSTSLSTTGQIGATSNSQNRTDMQFMNALVYSAGVMMLQKPEPLPANKRAKSLVLLQTALGPLQIALLALAIRRRFMR